VYTLNNNNNAHVRTYTMSSDSEADFNNEKYRYPACEADDCYCKRHWPSRSGGDENWVVDNNCDGDLVVRCDTAIDNDDDINKCDICERWMIGVDMQLHDAYAVCMRCTDKLDFIEIFTKIVDTACKCFVSFPEWEEDFSLIDPQLQRGPCLECNETHLLCPNYAEMTVTTFECGYALKNMINELTTREKPHAIANALAEALVDEITAAFERIDKARGEAKEQRLLRKQELAARCVTARKHFLCEAIPMLSRIPSEDFDKHVPSKFARITNDEDIKIIESFDGTLEGMTTEDVIKFARFLSP